MRVMSRMDRCGWLVGKVDVEIVVGNRRIGGEFENDFIRNVW